VSPAASWSGTCGGKYRRAAGAAAACDGGRLQTGVRCEHAERSTHWPCKRGCTGVTHAQRQVPAHVLGLQEAVKDSKTPSWGLQMSNEKAPRAQGPQRLPAKGIRGPHDEATGTTTSACGLDPHPQAAREAATATHSHHGESQGRHDQGPERLRDGSGGDALEEPRVLAEAVGQLTCVYFCVCVYFVCVCV
jgi:hypothetical protein